MKMSATGLVQVYTADPNGAATPVMVDPGNVPFTVPPVKVTLSVDCFQLCPPGFPAPPSETGVTPVQWYPHKILAGTVMVHFASVAAALVAANAATLA